MARTDIAGLVLAGGGSRRFGGQSKAFQILGGVALIEHAMRPLASLEHVAINANTDADKFARFGAELVPDITPDSGPLGGVEAGLEWAARLQGAKWLVTVAVDVPFLPDDFVELLDSMSDGVLVVASATEADSSPVCALWSLQQRPLISRALAEGVRKMTDYLARVPWRTAQMMRSNVDPLFNVNTPEALAEAERFVTELRRNRGV